MKQWDELALKAKQIAKHIVTGEEVNKKKERLTHIVNRLDTFATDALNSKYSNAGSVAFIHTYNGGNQVISTKHSDGSEGSFNTKGICEPNINFMDVEVAIDIKNNLDESKTNKNMKNNTIKLNESQLKKIVAESVKRVMKESRYEMGRGEIGIDASYGRIEKALNVLRQIADTMSENGYYESEESALRSQINYIEQEIEYIKNNG